jgi:hypothetical protein
MLRSIGSGALLAALLGVGACPKPQDDAPATAASGPVPAPAPVHAAEPVAVPVPAPVTTADQIQVPVLVLSQTAADVAKGQQLFTDRGCATCHLAMPGVKAIGPDLQGVTARRPLQYLERMILRPDVMIRTDPVAKALFGQFSVPMTNQRIDPVKELPFLVDYLKSLERVGEK